jgi:hypothetical protein
MVAAVYRAPLGTRFISQTSDAVLIFVGSSPA